MNEPTNGTKSLDNSALNIRCVNGIDCRKNNIIIHGIEESENNSGELMELVLKTPNNINKNINSAEWDKYEISNIERLGKEIQNEKKHRPVKVTLTLGWRKLELLKNKKAIPKTIKITIL
ncbi:unnamed protein product [Leptidea sinapis]|uniref:Uncharacterized protein n=1 Tax=Leptidea sinapis TaxID=189913 RepID=A0A5E4PV57_9NEOP|nr:unnamed protein product [Leptidea sinapis]